MLLSFVCYFVKENFFADAVLHDVEAYCAFVGMPDTREVLGNLRFTVLGGFVSSPHIVLGPSNLWQ